MLSRFNPIFVLAIAWPLFGAAAHGQTNATFTVAADTDDADEISDGTVHVTDGSSFFSGHVGFRFQNVTIPAGATITSATLEVFSNANGTTSFSVNLTAQDADSPPTFSTTSNNISSRTRTSNQTPWSTGSVTYSVGDSIVSPNFASSIQEVIDRSGWSSGNALVVITTPNSGDKGIFKRSGAPSYAPLLHVTYTTGASTFYVRTDGSDSNSGTGSAASQAWRTIEHALTSSSVDAGATVHVMAGTYTEEIAPTRDGASGSPIHVIADRTGAIFGGGGGDVTIQAPSGVSVFDLEFDDYLTFTGFKIQGNGTDAVFMSDCDGLVFSSCEVYGGVAGFNIAGSSTPTLINCLVRDNSDDGIGLHGGTTIIYNCTIVANGDDGLDAGNSSATILNSIIANNGGNGFSRQSDGDGTFSQFYNLLYNNTAGNHNGSSTGAGEVNNDPQFTGAANYSLQGTSPAIDAGLNASGTVDEDIRGVGRPQGAAWDMGAYEGTDIVAQWKLDETSGTKANDSSGNGHDADYTSGVTLAGAGPYPGAGANAAVFSGSGDRVDLPTLNPNFAGGLTISVWYQASSISGSHMDLVSLSNGQLVDDIWLGLDATGGLEFFVSDPVDGGAAFRNLNEGTAPVLGNWRHGVVVLDSSGDATLYHDGEVVATGFTGLPPTVSRNLNRIGQSVYSYETNGSLFDVRLYSRALSPAEVAVLYGFVGHWRFDETSGTTAADETDVANDGTLGGGPTWSTGLRGGSILFDGSDDYVEVAHDDAYLADDGTIALWFKPGGLTGEQVLFSKDSNGFDTGGHLTIYLDDGTPTVRLQSTTTSYTLAAPTDVQVDRWTFLTFEWGTRGMRLLVNGELVATNTSYTGGLGSTSGGAGNSEPFAVGANTWSSGDGVATPLDRFFAGEIDDLRFYSRSLSDAEVAELYGLVGHWKFDEVSGVAAADSSGKANNATQAGTTPGVSGPYPGAGQYAAGFDGANDATATDADFEPPATGAVAFWMRGSGTPSARGRLFGVGPNWEARQETNGNVSFDLGASPFVGNEPFATPAVDVDGRWYHVVANFDEADDSYEVYVDGQLTAAGISPVDLVPQSAGTLSFGTRTGSSELWEGALYDFRVYNRNLQDYEVSELYGLVAHWKLDETSGSVAKDSTFMNNDGVVSGDLGWTASGQVDGAFDFETTDGVDTINAGTFDVDGSGVSVTGWIRAEDGFSDGRIVIKSDGNNGADQLWGLTLASAHRLDFRVRVGGTFNQLDSPNNAITPGQWHHVAGTYEETTMRLYIDGVEVASAAHTVGGKVDTDSAAPVLLGDSPVGSRTYDGMLDNMRVFNRALSLEEIQRQASESSGAGLRIIRWVEVQ